MKVFGERATGRWSRRWGIDSKVSGEMARARVRRSACQRARRRRVDLLPGGRGDRLVGERWMVVEEARHLVGSLMVGMLVLGLGLGMAAVRGAGVPRLLSWIAALG